MTKQWLYRINCIVSTLIRCLHLRLLVSTYAA